MEEVVSMTLDELEGACDEVPLFQQVRTLTPLIKMEGGFYLIKRNGVRSRLLVPYAQPLELCLEENGRFNKIGKARIGYTLLDVEVCVNNIWILDVMWWDGIFLGDKDFGFRMSVVDLGKFQIKGQLKLIKQQLYNRKDIFEHIDCEEGFIYVGKDNIAYKWKKEPTVDMRLVKSNGVFFFATRENILMLKPPGHLARVLKEDSIYECCFDGDCLLPVKERKDKIEPNSYLTYKMTQEVKGWNPFDKTKKNVQENLMTIGEEHDKLKDVALASVWKEITKFGFVNLDQIEKKYGTEVVANCERCYLMKVNRDKGRITANFIPENRTVFRVLSSILGDTPSLRNYLNYNQKDMNSELCYVFNCIQINGFFEGEGVRINSYEKIIKERGVWVYANTHQVQSLINRCLESRPLAAVVQDFARILGFDIDDVFQFFYERGNEIRNGKIKLSEELIIKVLPKVRFNDVYNYVAENPGSYLSAIVRVTEAKTSIVKDILSMAAFVNVAGRWFVADDDVDLIMRAKLEKHILQSYNRGEESIDIRDYVRGMKQETIDHVMFALTFKFDLVSGIIIPLEPFSLSSFRDVKEKYEIAKIPGVFYGHNHLGLEKGKKILHSHLCTSCGFAFSHVHTIKSEKESEQYPQVCYSEKCQRGIIVDYVKKKKDRDKVEDVFYPQMDISLEEKNEALKWVIDKHAKENGTLNNKGRSLGKSYWGSKLQGRSDLGKESDYGPESECLDLGDICGEYGYLCDNCMSG